jgi:hypothetical protein
VHTGSSVFLYGESADYETCATNTAYVPGGRYLTGAIVEGHSLCVETGERRYSAIKITDKQDEQITIEVVTYDPPKRRY